MKKSVFLWAILCLCQLTFGQTTKTQDSSQSTQNKRKAEPDLNIESIEDVIVKTFQRNAENAHPAFETVKSKDLNLRNLGQDIPMLLQHQTGIVSTSDAGNGIGYTGIRVRGSDATRTHISVNGVPINDAESQGTFWVNMPDLASSAKFIHIQRGVGSSVHGAGAFGGSVMIQTGNDQYNQFHLDASYGSFNTRKITAKYHSPITQIKGRNWSYDLRISHIGSDGFIDRASTQMYGYLASVQSSSEKGWNHKLLAFGGVQKTFQAWWGIPIEKYRLGPQNTSSKDTLALQAHYSRNIGMYRNFQDSLNLFNAPANRYNYYLYPNENDQYQQHHLHYYLSKNINPKININTTFYYTFGQGFFEQFRYNDELSYYGLPPRINNQDTSNLANLVRRRWLQNHLLGINTHITYHYDQNNKFLWGLGANQYLGQHFGHVIAAGNPIDDVTQIESNLNYSINSPHYPEYYRSSGNKTDLNTFLKWQFQPKNIQNFNLYTDAQLRYVKHEGTGTDNDLKKIDFSGEFLFFNPKVGMNYLVLHKHSQSIIQGSVSVGNREPARSDFVDNPKNNTPKPETLIDYELGYQWIFSENKGSIQMNFYYMDYYNQLVLTGAVNDVGTPLRQNVDRSYRRGIELGGMFKAWQNKNMAINILGNIAWSQNIIKKSPASWVDYADYSTFDTVYENAPIAYSPNTVASAGIQYQYLKNDYKWEFQWLHKYVSQQFLDNTGNQDRSIPAYHFSEFQIAYAQSIFKQRKIQLKFLAQNIFNQRFVNNGYTWGYLFNRELTQEVFVFPSAPFNASLALSFIW